MSLKNLPILEPRFLLGLRVGVRGNALYTSENDQVLYPVGSVLALHDHTTRKQRFLRLPDRAARPAVICLSPSRKLAAVSESGRRAALWVIELEANDLWLRRQRPLCAPAGVEGAGFTTAGFTCDESRLVAVVGSPHWLLCCFSWQRGTLHSSAKLPLYGTFASVEQVLCHPTDDSMVCLVGPGVLQLLTVSGAAWHQLPAARVELLPISCGCWLSNDQLLCGTRDGRLVLLQNGQLRATFRAAEVLSFDAESAPPLQPTDQLLSASTSTLEMKDPKSLDDMTVREILSFHKGVAYSCGVGKVHVFEKEEGSLYQKRNIFIVEKPEFAVDVFDMNTIQTLSVNVAGDHLLAVTNCCQLYHVRLWGPHMNEEPEIPFSLLGERLHHGPISGLCTCLWKPIFITCGRQDHTLRIWNYETERQMFIRQYKQQLHCTAVHPTGLFIAVGFEHKLIYMTVLLSDVLPLQYFPIKACSECVFSTHGQIFAAADGSTVRIYSCITFKNVLNLEGHRGKVCSIRWACMDNMLVSCSPDGGILIWDIPRGEMTGSVMLGPGLSQIAVTSDGKTIISVSKDGLLREITDNTVVRVLSLADQPLNCVVFSHSNLMLFASLSSGSVLSVLYPLSETAEYIEYSMQSYPFTQMCITHNDENLVSCSEYGTVCLWKISSADVKTITLDKDFQYSDDVFVKSDYLANLMKSEERLKVEVEMLKAKFESKTIELEHAEKLAETHRIYADIIEDLKDKVEQLENEHEQIMNELNNDLTKMDECHKETIQNITDHYELKLVVEYVRYRELEEADIKMRADYERELQELIEAKTKCINKLIEKYEKQVQEKAAEFENLVKQVEKQTQKHEEIKQQIEDDADHETVDLRTAYEQLLREERNISDSFRKESTVWKNRLKSLQKAGEECVVTFNETLAEHHKYQQKISSLEKDTEELKQELCERDNALQDKDQGIADLKESNQELNKLKFILHYKTEELRNQIQPKDIQIQNKKEQMMDITEELQNLQKTKTSLDLQFVELKEKLIATEREICISRQENNENNALLHQIRNDLHDASRHLNETTQLKKLVMNLYHKYHKDKALFAEHLQVFNAQAQFLQQRDLLERTVTSLKKQVTEEPGKEKAGAVSLMKENQDLLDEMAKLREELKAAQESTVNLEAILSPSGQQTVIVPLKAIIRKAVTAPQEISNQYQPVLEERDTVIALLKERLYTLMKQVSADERASYIKEMKRRKTLFF